MCPACMTTIGVAAACAISTQALAELMEKNRRMKADASTKTKSVDNKIKLKGGQDVSTEKCAAR